MSSEETPKTKKVALDPYRIMVWFDRMLNKRPLPYFLAGALVLILAILLGPNFWTSDSILDRIKVGERAEGNLKATRSFEYMPTDEKLEQQRAEAEEKILPVFDYHADLGTIIISRINNAFNVIVPTTNESGDSSQPNASLHQRRKLKVRQELVGQTPAYWEEKRKQFCEALQIELSSKEFDILKKANFSAEVRATLQLLIGTMMNQFLVAHRGVLSPFSGKPIVVRHMIGDRLGRSGEEKITNFRIIKDLPQALEQLRDLANVHTAKFSRELGKVVLSLAQRLMVSNLTFNRVETKNRAKLAREQVRPRPISFVKGQVIVRDGDPITKEHKYIIQAMEASNISSNAFQEVLGVGFFVLLVVVGVFSFAKQQFKRFFDRPRDILTMGVLLIAFLALAKGAVSVGGGIGRGQELRIYVYILPFAAGAMLVRLLISAEAAALFALILSSLSGLLFDRQLGLMLYYFVTSLVGAAGVAQVQSRSTILRSGLAAGVVGGALLLSTRMFQGDFAEIASLYAFLGAIAGGVLSSFMTLALLPAMEWLFAYTTDVTLLELANLNHPLLRDLILRSPGTYHHSMIVGSLSETACEAIGANGLLARVASYYHDVGKMKNAVYFAENFKPGENPHNRLKPSMSALIIRNHVKDSMEMLSEHGIPELVIETATQHHGKTLIEFFFHKAKEQKEEDEEVHEEDYRYPGPKPQTREAGVIMLADAVEAAARSLADPTEDWLRAVVQRVINAKFTDGQLDHCDLTLRDLHLIAKSFLQVLRGIYHQRPTYPWQAQQRQEKKQDTSKFKVMDHLAETKEEGKGKLDTGGKGKLDTGGKGKPDTGGKGKPDTGGKGKPDTGKGREGRRTREESVVQVKDDSKGKSESNGKDKDGKKGKAPTQDMRAEPIKKVGTGGGKQENGKGKRNKNQATGEHSTVREGASPEGVEPLNTQETPPEGNQDIKRLGLS